MKIINDNFTEKEKEKEQINPKENKDNEKEKEKDNNLDKKNIDLNFNFNFNFNQKTSDLLNSDIYKHYLFKKEELEKIKVDITFNDINNTNNNMNSEKNIDQTQLAVEFTKKHLKLNPEMGFLIRIVKRLLQITNLNNSFNGNFIFYP